MFLEHMFLEHMFLEHMFLEHMFLEHMFLEHTIETYGRGPYNRNIWSYTIGRRRRRHAWPILLFVPGLAVYPLLASMLGVGGVTTTPLFGVGGGRRGSWGLVDGS